VTDLVHSSNSAQRNPHVSVVSINILNGVLTGTISFKPHLNLISGENGTLKTKLLQEIQRGQYLPSPAGTQPQIQAISPKRNSERRAVASIIQQLRQNNRTRDSYLAERISAQMQDAQYQEYPSVGELFFLEFQYRLRDGGEQIDHMNATRDDFNFVIQSVFPEYRLLAEWDTDAGSPSLAILKGGINEVPLEALSLGEQEVLSLITNLHVSREANDVYLIDEPEVHLNWHLEERLFSYFYDFCKRYDKQIIVVFRLCMLDPCNGLETLA
jgi:predicted ATPase